MSGPSNVSKQKSAMPPNYVHSLDSTSHDVDISLLPEEINCLCNEFRYEACTIIIKIICKYGFWSCVSNLYLSVHNRVISCDLASTYMGTYK